MGNIVKEHIDLLKSHFSGGTTSRDLKSGQCCEFELCEVVTKPVSRIIVAKLTHWCENSDVVNPYDPIALPIMKHLSSKSADRRVQCPVLIMISDGIVRQEPDLSSAPKGTQFSFFCSTQINHARDETVFDDNQVEVLSLDNDTDGVGSADILCILLFRSECRMSANLSNQHHPLYHQQYQKVATQNIVINIAPQINISATLLSTALTSPPCPLAASLTHVFSMPLDGTVFHVQAASVGKALHTLIQAHLTDNVTPDIYTSVLEDCWDELIDDEQANGTTDLEAHVIERDATLSHAFSSLVPKALALARMILHSQRQRYKVEVPVISHSLGLSGIIDVLGLNTSVAQKNSDQTHIENIDQVVSVTELKTREPKSTQTRQRHNAQLNVYHLILTSLIQNVETSPALGYISKFEESKRVSENGPMLSPISISYAQLTDIITMRSMIALDILILKKFMKETRDLGTRDSKTVTLLRGKNDLCNGPCRFCNMSDTCKTVLGDIEDVVPTRVDGQTKILFRLLEQVNEEERAYNHKGKDKERKATEVVPLKQLEWDWRWSDGGQDTEVVVSPHVTAKGFDNHLLALQNLREGELVDVKWVEGGIVRHSLLGFINELDDNSSSPSIRISLSIRSSSNSKENKKDDNVDDSECEETWRPGNDGQKDVIELLGAAIKSTISFSQHHKTSDFSLLRRYVISAISNSCIQPSQPSHTQQPLLTNSDLSIGKRVMPPLILNMQLTPTSTPLQLSRSMISPKLISVSIRKPDTTEMISGSCVFDILDERRRTTIIALLRTFLSQRQRRSLDLLLGCIGCKSSDESQSSLKRHHVIAIEGMPGCGKSYLIATFLVTYLITFYTSKRAFPRVLLTALTNLAVDNVLEAIELLFENLAKLDLGDELHETAAVCHILTQALIVRLGPRSTPSLPKGYWLDGVDGKEKVVLPPMRDCDLDTKETDKRTISDSCTERMDRIYNMCRTMRLLVGSPCVVGTLIHMSNVEVFQPHPYSLLGTRNDGSTEGVAGDSSHSFERDTAMIMRRLDEYQKTRDVGNGRMTIKVPNGVVSVELPSPEFPPCSDDICPFDLCLIDEASLVPFQRSLRILNRSKAIAVIGDSQQLGPISSCNNNNTLSGQYNIKSDTVDDKDVLSYSGLNTSLFNIIKHIADADGKISLTEQYRLRPLLTSFWNFVFVQKLKLYPSPLICKRKVDGKSDAVLKDCLTMINIDGKEPDAVSSLVYNNALMLNKKRGISISNIGVITGYRASVFKLKSYASTRGQWAKDLEVSTVDAYQGRSIRAVILVVCSPQLTATAAGESNNIFNNIQRLNVALSRARDVLVVLGSFSFFKASEGPLRHMYEYYSGGTDPSAK